MSITFSGETYQNIFGGGWTYLIQNSINGFDIIDDFGGHKGHIRTRIRLSNHGRHVYVKHQKVTNKATAIFVIENYSIAIFALFFQKNAIILN